MSSVEINSSNTEANHTVATHECKIKGGLSEAIVAQDQKDENLIQSLKLLKEYSKDVALKYAAITSDINMINLTLTKILRELEKEET